MRRDALLYLAVAFLFGAFVLALSGRMRMAGEDARLVAAGACREDSAGCL